MANFEPRILDSVLGNKIDANIKSKGVNDRQKSEQFSRAHDSQCQQIVLKGDLTEGTARPKPVTSRFVVEGSTTELSTLLL